MEVTLKFSSYLFAFLWVEILMEVVMIELFAMTLRFQRILIFVRNFERLLFSIFYESGLRKDLCIV